MALSMQSRARSMLQRGSDIYVSAPLRRLLDAQMREVRPDLQRCAGTHALMISASQLDLPPGLPMLGCWASLRVGVGGYRGDAIAALNEPLPFVDEAFELVLLRHAQEVVPAAREWLTEVLRTLAPGGLLVITGVHPISAWVPWFYWRSRAAKPVLRMPLALGRAMQAAGVEIERVRRVGRTWPGAASVPLVRAGWWGGGYVLIARKRRRAVTPLRIKPVPMVVSASSGRLSPSARQHTT
jgi:SAM-dependent methyltransferase